MAVGERMITDESGVFEAISPFYNTNCIVPGLKQAKVFMMTSFLPCQVLVRREVFEKIGGVDERHIVNLDGLLWFKCALQRDVAYVQDPVSVYRFHHGQTTAQYNLNINHMMEYYCTLTAMFKLGQNIPYLRHHFDDAVRRTAEITVRYCWDVIKNKNYELARRYLMLAAVFYPEISEHHQYQKIEKHLNSTTGGQYEISKELVSANNNSRDRGFSYDPPEESVVID